MKFTGEVRVAYGNDRLAQAVAGALAPEDEDFIRSRVEEGALVADAEAATPEGLLRSLDDFLACLAAAEDAARHGSR